MMHDTKMSGNHVRRRRRHVDGWHADSSVNEPPRSTGTRFASPCGDQTRHFSQLCLVRTPSIVDVDIARVCSVQVQLSHHVRYVACSLNGCWPLKYVIVVYYSICIAHGVHLSTHNIHTNTRRKASDRAKNGAVTTHRKSTHGGRMSPTMSTQPYDSRRTKAKVYRHNTRAGHIAHATTEEDATHTFDTDE